jgi:hypothetical protein
VTPLIDDARRRQRRRRIALTAVAVLACAGLAIGLAFATSGGGKTAAPPSSAPTRPGPYHTVRLNHVTYVLAQVQGSIVRKWCVRTTRSGSGVFTASYRAATQTSGQSLPRSCRN